MHLQRTFEKMHDIIKNITYLVKISVRNHTCMVTDHIIRKPGAVYHLTVKIKKFENSKWVKIEYYG